MIGVVKETGVDDNALINFHTHYFRKYPLYRDSDWRLYRAMGARRLSPFQLVAGFVRSLRRHREKGIENVLTGGDVFMQGGVLVFDRKGELRYAYDEEYGVEFNVEILKSMIQAARDEQ